MATVIPMTTEISAFSSSTVWKLFLYILFFTYSQEHSGQDHPQPKTSMEVKCNNTIDKMFTEDKKCAFAVCG
jgi:hypothetical protein